MERYTNKIGKNCLLPAMISQMNLIRVEGCCRKKEHPLVDDALNETSLVLPQFKAICRCWKEVSQIRKLLILKQSWVGNHKLKVYSMEQCTYLYVYLYVYEYVRTCTSTNELERNIKYNCGSVTVERIVVVLRSR